MPQREMIEIPCTRTKQGRDRIGNGSAQRLSRTTEDVINGDTQDRPWQALNQAGLKLDRAGPGNRSAGAWFRSLQPATDWASNSGTHRADSLRFHRTVAFDAIKCYQFQSRR